jgi:poly-gamma-glutamate synthesis protein (capsule biosynthesis protein)
VVGIGADRGRALAPATFELNGVTVAVLAASDADADPTADPTGQWAARRDRAGTADATDPRWLLRAVRSASGTADVTVVYLHWGIQGKDCPSRSQRSLARALAAAGADVVVGAHAHRLQGAGMLGGTHVAYGLGNFIWFHDEPAATGLMTLALDAEGVEAASWAPALVTPGGLPRFAIGRRAERLESARDALRACTGLD